MSESAKDLKALLEQRQRDQARIERLGERLRLAEAKVVRMREYIATSVVKDERTCNCFPCIEGRRLLEETG